MSRKELARDKDFITCLPALKIRLHLALKLSGRTVDILLQSTQDHKDGTHLNICGESWTFCSDNHDISWLVLIL